MEFTASQVYEINKRIIGKILPIEESNEDAKRFENLKIWVMS